MATMTMTTMSRPRALGLPTADSDRAPLAPATGWESARLGYRSGHDVTDHNCIALTTRVAGFAGGVADVNGSAPARVADTASPPS